MKDLGDRMKRYESVTQYKLTPRMPVIIRLDGKAFHTLTSQMNKPFDMNFITWMRMAAGETCRKVQGFKLAYVQSDEVNILLTDYDKLDTDGWFSYKLSKLLSLSAAMMSVHFSKYAGREAYFDSRAFNIPRKDVANYFLWRAKDWARNSLSMYAQAFFSHKDLMNKHSSDVHEMLHGIGKNWATDLSDICKNGTWFSKFAETNFNLSTYQEIEELIEGLENVDSEKHL